MTELYNVVNECSLLQGAIDPCGEQVGPGGTQQHGDHPANHESIPGYRDLCRGKRSIHTCIYCINLLEAELLGDPTQLNVKEDEALESDGLAN